MERIIALDEVKVEFAMPRTPDGHGEIELVKFHLPATQTGDRHAPANTPGLRHLAFLVDNIHAVVAGLQARGTELAGELVRYEDSYRLCYVRGLEGSSSSWQRRSADGSGPSPPPEQPSEPTSFPVPDRLPEVADVPPKAEPDQSP